MEKKSPVYRLLSIIGLLAVSIVGGAAASSLVADSVIGSLVSSAVLSSSVPSRPTPNINVTRVSESVRAAVSVYKKRPASASGIEKVLLPSDQVGAGIVLTNDGWAAFPDSLISGAGQLVAVFSNASSSAIDPSKAVRDEATGIVFLKLDAQRLSVAPFGDDSKLHAADPVFLADSSSVSTAAVVSPRRLPAATRGDYLESSEILGRRIIIDHEGVPGQALVDANGETVGLCLGDGTAVPISFVEQVMRGVFRDGKVSRPNLGVRFISLDNLPNAKEAGFAASGALVSSSGPIRAVARGSAAEAAGLKDGDVITALEHDRIDGEETLSERLQDYQPGAKVEFSVERGGQQVKVSVTLK